VIEKMLQSLMSEIQKISRADTVIGQPIKSGESTIVPICQVHIGFGAAGMTPNPKEEKNPSDFSGTGIGGGIRVDPVACVIVDKNGRAQLLQISGGTSSTVGKVIDLVPEVLDRFGLTRDALEGKKEPAPAKKAKNVKDS